VATQSNAEEVPRSVGRVLDVLETVLASAPMNLTSVASSTGLTPTTALRHLRALVARGYLQRDDVGVFSAGPTMLRLTATLQHVGPLERLIRTAQPHLDKLAAAVGESAYLAIGDANTATYVAAAECTRAIRHVGWVGQNLSISDTAVGGALTNRGAIVCKTGAVEPDITAISLALETDSIVAAVSVVGPTHRLDVDARASVSRELLEMVERLRQALGSSSEGDLQ
jgi:DNA-binding IclR family transcriptional regulator